MLYNNIMDKVVEELLTEKEKMPLLARGKKYLDTKFKKIAFYTRGNEKLTIYDDYHAIERFKERFDNLSMSDYQKILSDGVKVIYDKYSAKKGFYWIISKSTGVVIPLKLYVDADNFIHSMIGAIDTTYMSHFNRDSYKINGVKFSKDGDDFVSKEIMVESKDVIKKLTESKTYSQWTEYSEDNCLELIHYFEEGEHTINGIIIEID